MLSGWTMPGDGARRGRSRRAAEPQANLLTRLELLMVLRELQPVGGPRGPPDTNVKTLPPLAKGAPPQKLSSLLNK